MVYGWVIPWESQWDTEIPLVLPWGQGRVYEWVILLVLTLGMDLCAFSLVHRLVHQWDQNMAF